MAFAQTDDGVRLYYEEHGAGVPIVFVHEFAGDYRSWAPQTRYFSRNHHCIAYNARGFPPSDVPESMERYSQDRAVADLLTVLDHLGIGKAHVVGLSMGGFATLHFGLNHPGRVLSLVVAGCGYGSDREIRKGFQSDAEAGAQQLESMGSKAFAEIYGAGPTRVQFQGKDPQGWREMVDMLGEHSALGSALTLRGVQARRPSLFALEDRLREMTVPTLIVTGDEDDPCLRPNLFLKRMIPASGLLVLPKSGHTVNLEEPAAFNAAVAAFIAAVTAGSWGPRDPRAVPGAAIKVKS